MTNELSIPEIKVATSSPFHTLPTRVEMCGQWMPAVSRRDGHHIKIQSVCGSFDCEVHGPQRAGELVTAVARCLSKLEQVWVTAVDAELSRSGDGDRTSRTLERMRRRRARSNSSIDYLWVRRGTSLFILATSDLGGRKPPTNGEWIDPQGAVDLLADALRFPGVTKTKLSGGWRPKVDHTPSRLYVPGPIADRVWIRACEEAADRIECRYGMRPNAPRSLPEGIDADVYITELESATKEARAAGRQRKRQHQLTSTQ